MPNFRTHYIYVRKDVRIRGDFSRPKGVREQTAMWNIGTHSSLNAMKTVDGTVLLISRSFKFMTGVAVITSNIWFCVEEFHLGTPVHLPVVQTFKLSSLL